MNSSKPYLFLKPLANGDFTIVAEAEDAQKHARQVARDLEPGQYVFVRALRSVDIPEPQVTKPAPQWGDSLNPRGSKAGTDYDAGPNGEAA